ncbi:phosphotransferase system, enzyme I, PtsI [Ignavigranum ruoffiae]|uniref:Phosphoenolpyruvate-protein phosphotransferase n=1 Tax=Ignavigranum ruoffiae TaxID=89093 RepID=A0A1H9FXY2_9LACT|nr:phosphoenolpyruvate--protein phosphotransferase [Ignavigranum ruoffiae]UPQ85841.1 phosphoenolpyruvate--protein phosphotransferase [Ignavigranum ruoffiae]SEQ42453.1 phosphotransferase system, enzyme I, PtsI [Ignavigranum ruoffiae]
MTAEFLAGIAASDGIAIAPAYLLTEPDLSFEKKTISDSGAEILRFEEAVKQAHQEISLIKKRAEESLGSEEAQVFEAHLMFLDDPEFIGQIKQVITDQLINAEAALDQIAQMFITMFSAMEDNPYMQERAADIKDVSERMMAILLGLKVPSPATIDHEVIVVAHDLTPSDTAQLNKKYVKAFVTDIGGRTSHSAIMARSLEIPAIVGSQSITQSVKDGQTIIVDALAGQVILNPSQEDIANYQQKAQDFQKQKEEWAKLVDAPSVTQDGHQVELAANIGTPKDVEAVLANGAEGIGLYRTEFLYMDSANFPTEDEQFEAYKTVLEAMEGKPVIVRTMDIGGDKELPYLDLPKEMNPFLGYRAIRISLDRTEIFKTQLRALLRASNYGNLRIMFPMIATLKEFRQAKAVLEAVKADLLAEGQTVADTIQVGIMVEIPAAAVLADQFAKEVDFFSIGTNDLIQYTMAADRMNEQVSYLYQPYNPSILRLIKNVIDASHREGKWTGMCGEMAGDQTAVPILLGMGLDEFSMSASSVLKTRSLMQSLTLSDLQKLADRALNEAGTVDEVVEMVQALTQNK